jgi:uncharacterized membrane protein
MATNIEHSASSFARTGGGQHGLSFAKRGTKRLPGTAFVNVGKGERQISLAAGAVTAILGVARRDIPGMLMAAVGAGLVYRGVSGHCSVYDALGIDSRSESDARTHTQGVRVAESFLVDKPIDELYAFWRDLENLPTIMSHLESVNVIDERRSHWVAKAPKIVGGSVEWDAEIVEDRPNARIAWRSLPGADVDNLGAVDFSLAPGDRGTVVRVKLEYSPPAGRIGSWFAKLFGENPESQIREDLRNFKRVMEIGESLTTKGQSRGACVGGIGRLMS